MREDISRAWTGGGNPRGRTLREEKKRCRFSVWQPQSKPVWPRLSRRPALGKLDDIPDASPRYVSRGLLYGRASDRGLAETVPPRCSDVTLQPSFRCLLSSVSSNFRSFGSVARTASRPVGHPRSVTLSKSISAHSPEFLLWISQDPRVTPD